MNSNTLDRVEFRKLFEAHAQHIRNFIYYKCGNVEQAEDIMQETFLRLWREREKIDLEKVKSFLFTVANNLFLDSTRRQKVALKYQQEPVNDRDHESPEHVLEQKEFRARLEGVINALPETQREVFLLNRIEKLTYREIAERLGISVKAVEKRMGKALKRLRTVSARI
ncbi:MAG: RNA polymerase sigma factor [Bacteroidota bacterium]